MTSKEKEIQKSFEDDPIQYLEDLVKSIKPPRVVCIGGPAGGGKIVGQMQQAFADGYTRACEDFLKHLDEIK